MNTYHSGDCTRKILSNRITACAPNTHLFSSPCFYSVEHKYFKFSVMNSQLFPKTSSATKSKSKTKPLYLYQHRKGKLINCTFSSPLRTTLLTKVIHPFHAEKAKLHCGRDKVNHMIIHLHGLPM